MENLKIKHEDFDATYSPEDNKLRITAAYRLPENLYKQFKEMGFRWAPKQEVFIAPMWTPAREDFCLRIAGGIEAEQSTMVDRAEAKVERLENLAEKRGQQSNHFAAAADRIAERFHGGQPILIGHHSESKARKDHKQMENSIRKSIECAKAVDYWLYKAEGVGCHANHKANPGVRARRIKGLLADLRSHQRDINHFNVCVKLWTKINGETDPEKFNKLVDHYIGGYIKTGHAVPYGLDLWSKLRNGEITHKEAALQALESREKALKNPYYYRWVAHIVNRLGYERSELGPVEKFEGELTPVILQCFTREQGAHTPKAKKTETGFIVSSFVALPAHICEYPTLELDAQGWIDLMQVVGYTIPTPKAKQPPILNFKAESLSTRLWGDMQTFPQIEMTKAEYKKLNGFICLSPCGQFRFRLGYTGIGYKAIRKAVFLTDSKVHNAPESEAINQELQEV